jgi:hypothetical protein
VLQMTVLTCKAESTENNPFVFSIHTLLKSVDRGKRKLHVLKGIANSGKSCVCGCELFWGSIFQ